ncbi:MAG: hypothetical protein K2X03_10745 [Bryobacteraceae bacterium]|nr:hypothetical protein [Bryobacteraceae bacterium]
MTRPRTLLILTLLTIALALLLWRLSPPHPEQARLGYSTSAFALQMARDWPSLSIILATPARAGFRIHTLVDFILILVYGALWGGLAWRLIQGRWRRATVVALVVLAMYCDIRENFAILQVLDLQSGFTDEMADAIRGWALWKWLLLMGVWFGLALAWLARRVPPLAVGYGAAAAVVAVAWFTSPALLQLTAPVMAVVLAAQAFYFSRL